MILISCHISRVRESGPHYLGRDGAWAFGREKSEWSFAG